MTEEENKGVEPEAQAVAPAAEAETENQTPKQSTPEQMQNREAAQNWVELRRKKEELERQTKEMRSRIEALEKQRSNANEIDELDKMGDDDIMSKAQVRRLTEKVALKAAQEAIRKREAETVEERLQLKYPDFASVVTPENIEILKQSEPELALSLSHSPDPHAQGVAAYKLMKRLGIGAEIKTSPESEKAKANSQKPVSVNAVTKTSAIGNAHMFENGLTSELKSQLWKEMQSCAKRA